MQTLIQLVQAKAWYPLAALVLMLALQFVRKGPAWLAALWTRVPNGWRFVGPLLMGAATAFVGAYSSGATLRQALAAAVAGVLGIGLPASGLHAWVKESPLPVDGGRGGDPDPEPPAAQG